MKRLRGGTSTASATRMNPRDRRVNAGYRGVAIAVAILVIAVIVGPLRPRIARADRVDDLIAELSSSSDRVRLSATLNLMKLGDPRAIDPLIARLKNDSEKSVRSTSASGLGQLVTSKVQGAQRARAVQALQHAEANDPMPVVQAQAGRALQAIGATSTPTPVPQAGGGIYVNIGPMSSKTGVPADDAKFRNVMVQVATKTMNRVAANMPTTWPGGGVPTKAQLAQKSIQGYFVDGTTNQVQVTVSGSTATISCKISMLLADFPNKSVFGFLNGSANVQGGSSPRDVELAREDCVAAVIEDLISKKIVPTIGSKSGISPTSQTRQTKAGNP